MTLLKTEKLRKAYGSLVVTKDVDLEIARGQRHVIIGPNGAGKTSLVHQLTGQVRPTSGKVIFKGVEVAGAAPTCFVRWEWGVRFRRITSFLAYRFERMCA